LEDKLELVANPVPVLVLDNLELVVPLDNNPALSVSVKPRWKPSRDLRLLDSPETDVSRPTSLVTRTKSSLLTFYLNKRLKMTMTHSTKELLCPLDHPPKLKFLSLTLHLLLLRINLWLKKSPPKISQLRSSPNLKRVPAQVKRNRTRNQKLTTTTEVTVTTSLMLALEPAVMPPKSLPSSEQLG
jgi:hypothetical protein